MRKTVAAILLLLPVFSCRFASAEPPETGTMILVLPFSGLEDEFRESRAGLAVGAMMEACFSRADGISLVDRGNLEAILAEQSLSLTGLTADEDALRVGRLVGARVMVSGRFSLEDDALALHGRAFDVETGVVAGAHSARGSRDSLPDLAHELCSSLSAALETRLQRAFEGPVATAPAASLRFMKGLSYYHAARYELSIGEFIAAAEAGSLSASAGLWMARSYIALGEFGNACLELGKVPDVPLPLMTARDISAAKERCRHELDGEEAALIRSLISGH